MPTKEQATRYSLFGIVIVVLTLTLQAVTPLGSVLGIVSDRAAQDSSVNLKLESIEKSTAEIEEQMGEFQIHVSNKFATFLPRKEYEIAERAQAQNESRRTEEVNRRLGELDKKADRSLELQMQILTRLSQ